jgi:hypothetical protein
VPAGPHEEEEKLWSGGVSDPAPALFGPLRAGSLCTIYQWRTEDAGPLRLVVFSRDECWRMCRGFFGRRGASEAGGAPHSERGSECRLGDDGARESHQTAA